MKMQEEEVDEMGYIMGSPPPPLSLSHCRSLVVQTGLVSGLLWVGTEDRGVAD